MHKKFIFLSFFALLATIAFVGCGSGKLKTVNVTGIVTLDGQPVEGASVRFNPVDQAMGHPAFGKTDVSGRYHLQTILGEVDAGTTPGLYMVTISKVELVGTGRMITTSEGEHEEMIGVERLPEKTANFSTTDIEREVENKRTNVFDFDF
jgi:hypothetical protein